MSMIRDARGCGLGANSSPFRKISRFTLFSAFFILTLLAALTAPAEPSRFATFVDDFNHPGGQSFGVTDNMLGGPRGGGAVGGLHIWSVGEDATGAGLAYATLGFDCIIKDGPGPDFIVFENGFFAGAGSPPNIFGELAFVEVSTDGTTFARFPNESMTVPPANTFPPTAVSGLAGNWPVFANVVNNPVAPWPFRAVDWLTDPAATPGGTLFDLSALAADPLVLSGDVDINDINFVRVVDIRGDGTYADSTGDPIYDGLIPGPTAFDFDAVSVINFREAGTHESEQFGRSAQGGSRQHIDATVTRIEYPVWETGAEGLAEQSSVCVLPGAPPRVFAWGFSGSGTSASVFVKAFDADDGSLAWTSPALDDGISVAFDSWSSPSADSATNAVYFATGTHVYRLDADDGTIDWDFPLTEPGSTDIVNTSCRIGGGRVFISTYGGIAPANKRLYAIDAATGTLDWSVQNGGSGSEAVAYVAENGTERVYCLLDLGMACLDATTGATVWTSVAPLSGGTPWSTTLSFFGGILYRDGALFASTYNFGGGSELVCVDAATGRLLWTAIDTLTSNNTPTLIGDAVYIVGHEFWGDPSAIAAHDVSTGTELWRTPVAASGSGMWLVSPTGVNDAIYVTEGQNAGGGIHILDPATGTDIAARNADSGTRTGTPAIGAAGEVYVLTSGGRLACYRAPSAGPLLLEDIDGNMPTGFTDDLTVRAVLGAADAVEMRISESPGGGSWVPYQMTSNITLSAGEGLKTAEAQTRNGSGDSFLASGSITYIAPTGQATATPSAAPTSTPSAAPTSTPSAAATATPTATATATPCCPGDANNSGSFVDANDFIAVQANFGADNGVGGPGDANCSGSFVDANDFIAVQANFGADCG